MSKKIFVYKFYSIAIIILLFSCKASEKADRVKLHNYSTKNILDKLTKSEFAFDSFSTKAAITFDNGNEKSFKTHLRIKKDSAIWISITPLLGIEMARVLITKDTVKMIDRIHSEYFIGDFNYINDFLKADLDYQMLEALLLGNSIDFERNERVRTSADRKKDLYYISTEKKRKIKMELKKEKAKIKQQTQVLWLDPSTFKIKSLLLKSPESNQSLAGEYSNFDTFNEQLLSKSLRFNLNSKIPIKIDIKYSKSVVDKPLTFPFKIPTKYEAVKQG